MNSKKKYKDEPFFLRGDNGIGILLLHGWTSPPDELRPLADYLNSFGYTVSAPLLRGHGTKPEDLAGVKWQDWLADAREALENLKKQTSRIFVGGISMSGNLAMLLSPDGKVAGIIVMGTAVKYRFHTLAKISLFFMGHVKTYRKKYYPPRVRKHMKGRKVYMYYPIENAKEIFRLAEYTRESLPKIEKPILVMQSTADHLVSKKSPKIIFDNVKSKVKEIFWIKNAYHVFAENKKTWEKIAGFISKVIKAKL